MKGAKKALACSRKRRCPYEHDESIQRWDSIQARKVFYLFVLDQFTKGLQGRINTDLCIGSTWGHFVG